MTTKRLLILEKSLEKKRALFDEKLKAHFDEVRSANGQPLNDKRCGARTMEKWDRQNDGLKKLDDSIKKTEAAIVKEKTKIAYSEVALESTPVPILELIKSGTLTQWRKFPNRFFINGGGKARIILNENGTIWVSHFKDLSTAEYQKVRDVFNKLKSDIEKIKRV